MLKRSYDGVEDYPDDHALLRDILIKHAAWLIRKFGSGGEQLKQYLANLMMRLAFRVFRRFHDYLPEAVTKEGIIWGEITRRPKPIKLDSEIVWCLDSDGRLCSTCVRELEEDRARQETIKRWLKGEMR
jgi:hypothetical protein